MSSRSSSTTESQADRLELEIVECERLANQMTQLAGSWNTPTVAQSYPTPTISRPMSPQSRSRPPPLTVRIQSPSRDISRPRPQRDSSREQHRVRLVLTADWETGRETTPLRKETKCPQPQRYQPDNLNEESLVEDIPFDDTPEDRWERRQPRKPLYTGDVYEDDADLSQLDASYTDALVKKWLKAKYKTPAKDDEMFVTVISPPFDSPNPTNLGEQQVEETRPFPNSTYYENPLYTGPIYDDEDSSSELYRRRTDDLVNKWLKTKDKTAARDDQPIVTVISRQPLDSPNPPHLGDEEAKAEEIRLIPNDNDDETKNERDDRRGETIVTVISPPFDSLNPTNLGEQEGEETRQFPDPTHNDDKKPLYRGAIYEDEDISQLNPRCKAYLSRNAANAKIKTPERGEELLVTVISQPFDSQNPTEVEDAVAAEDPICIDDETNEEEEVIADNQAEDDDGDDETNEPEEIRADVTLTVTTPPSDSPNPNTESDNNRKTTGKANHKRKQRREEDLNSLIQVIHTSTPLIFRHDSDISRMTEEIKGTRARR